MYPFCQNMLLGHSLELFRLVRMYNHLKWEASGLGGHHGGIGQIGQWPMQSLHVENPMRKKAGLEF